MEREEAAKWLRIKFKLIGTPAGAQYNIYHVEESAIFNGVEFRQPDSIKLYIGGIYVFDHKGKCIGGVSLEDLEDIDGK